MTLTETKRTWTPDRREELKMLFELICEARLLNKGTNVIQRLQKCVSIADELSRSNFVLPRESFIKFLEEKVCEQIQAE